MLRSKFRIAGDGLLLVAVVAAGMTCLGQRGLAGQRVPERGGRPAAAEVRGLLKAVDPGKQTLTVSFSRGREDASEETYALAKDAEVLLGDFGGRGFSSPLREGKLSDLGAGALVTLVLSADKKTVEAVVAEGPSLQALVKSVDAGKHTITVELGRRGRGEEAIEEKTFPVAGRAEIILDDGRGRRTSLKEGKLADLTAGLFVELKLSVDQQRVELVQARAPMVQGTLKAVDAAKRSLTVALPPGRGGDGNAEERTYTVAADAAIVADVGPRRLLSLRARKLADLPVGAHVAVKLSPNQETAVAIQAEGPTIVGSVKTVDAAKKTITVTVGASRTEAGQDKTFPIASNALIRVNGAEATLADIQSGEGSPPVALKLSLDQKTVQGIMAGGGGR
jgi:hypothetical protein